MESQPKKASLIIELSIKKLLYPDLYQTLSTELNPYVLPPLIDLIFEFSATPQLEVLDLTGLGILVLGGLTALLLSSVTTLKKEEKSE